MQETERESESLSFGSLFAGIGGFDLGFERAGLKCKWQVEIDDYATKVLEKNWPQVHRERDIKTCGKHNLEYVDVICGGFPCQDISYAGRGAGLDGERSGLFFEAIRLVSELRPRAIVLENVAALLTRGLDRVLGTLAEIGFDAEWHCIPAAAVGAPHIRDRVFVLAYATRERHWQRREPRDVCQKEWRQDDELLWQSGGTGEGESDVAYANDARNRASERRINGIWQASKNTGKQEPQSGISGRCKDVADTKRSRREGCERTGKARTQRKSSRHFAQCGQDVANTNDIRATVSTEGRHPSQQMSGSSGEAWVTTTESQWAVEPTMGELVNGVSGGLVRFAGRVASGVPNRTHKLRCLGNAVVPQVAELVGRMTIEILTKGEIK